MSAHRVRRAGVRAFVLLAVALSVMVLSTGVPRAPGLLAGKAAVAAGATTYWVDAASGVDANPGSQAEPFKTLTKACSVATSEDTIMVRPGTYSTTAGETFPLLLNGASLTSTDGAARTRIQGDGASAIVLAQYLLAGDIISGFTFTGGGVDPGGGLSVYFNWTPGPGEVRIEDNVFDGNTSGFNGGAVHVYGSGSGEYNVAVRRNAFRGNSADGSGGALHMYGTLDIAITDNVFSDNTAYNGGAVRVSTQGTSLEMSDNHFIGNEARGDGGGAQIIDNDDGTQLVERNRFWNNQAVRSGGALYLGGTDAVLRANEGFANVSESGGFAWLGLGSAQAENNLILGGSGTHGAAWYVTEAELSERNDTVAGNTGDTVTLADATSVLTIVNSIYWNQLTPTEIRNADSVSYSAVSDTDVGKPANGNTVGPRVIFDDPRFVDPGLADVRVRADSPCVDSADPAMAPPVDFFGTSRPYDGDGDGDAAPDMGYHEWVPATIQHDAAGVVFDRWVTGYSTAYSGGGYVYGRWTDTELTARFTGDRIRWVGPKQPFYGMADVYLDGVRVAQDVDCYAPAGSATLEAVIWDSGTLADSRHVLTIRLTGARNPASTGNVVVADRFEVDGVAPSGIGTRIDDKTAAPGYSGNWISAINPTYYDKTYSYSRWPGHVFATTFRGTKAAWLGPMTPFYGKAEIWLDGAYVETVDAYRSYQGWRERIWESGTLSPGTHTLEIRPTGEKNPSSTSANVVIDAIDVMP